MKRHFNRFSWLYLTLFAVIAYPGFIVYMQRVPKYDLPTLHRLDRLIQDGFIRSHPGAQIRRLTTADMLLFPTPPDYKGFIIGSLATQSMRVAAMPAVKPEMDRVTELCAPLFEKLDANVAHNTLFFPIGAADAPTTRTPTSENPMYNMLNIQILCKIRRSEAEAAIAERRWDDALHLLDSSANIMTPYRDNNLICALIAIATRAIAYGGYVDLLNAAPPPEVAQAALKSLVEMRKSDFTVGGWTWLGEKLMFQRFFRSESKTNRNSITFDSPGGVPDMNHWAMRSYWMQERVINIVKLRNQIKDPSLKAWADRFAQDNPISVQGGYLQREFVKQRLKWTDTPLARKWLKEMIRKEPWVYRNPLIPEEEYSNLDHWTLMQIGISPSSDPNATEGQVRSQVSQTYGCLTEAGFAARLYQDKYGSWPTELKQLAEFYPLPSNDASTSATSPTQSMAAFLPIRIAERKMTPELMAALRHAMNNWICFRDMGKSIHADGSFTFADSRQNASEWFDEPVRALAIEQLLKSHPRLVESAQLEVTTASVSVKDARLTLYGLNAQPGQPMMPGMMPVQPGMMPGVPAMMGNGAASNQYGRRPASPISFQPLDPALARQITENTYRLKAIATAKEAGYSGHGASGASGRSPAPPIVQPIADATTITQPSIVRIDRMRLTGKFRTPEKAMIIWSPGPDGKDDNAQIVYDATNGTVSSGDIVLFPENY